VLLAAEEPEARGAANCRLGFVSVSYSSHIRLERFPVVFEFAFPCIFISFHTLILSSHNFASVHIVALYHPLHSLLTPFVAIFCRVSLVLPPCEIARCASPTTVSLVSLLCVNLSMVIHAGIILFPPMGAFIVFVFYIMTAR